MIYETISFFKHIQAFLVHNSLISLIFSIETQFLYQCDVKQK